MNAPALLFDGKYRLIRQIGEGGMGTVHEAINARTGKKVAIKTMSPLVAKDTTQIERFMREARAATSIEHPNVVQVFDVGIDDSNVPYMVMELLQGESLAAMIEREGPISAPRLVSLLGPALGALSAAHKLGIIHRDLKPENIFLAQTPGTGVTVPKLLDFGISKILNADPGDMSLTHTGTVLGTPYYMAPEQAAGKRTIDQRTDVYSIGVILYWGLSARLPFNGENYNQLIVAILSDPVPPLPPTVPPGLAQVIACAMARDMNERFPTVEQLMAALGAAVGLHGGLVSATPLSDVAFGTARTQPVSAMEAARVVSPPTRMSPMMEPMASSAVYPVASAPRPAAMPMYDPGPGTGPYTPPSYGAPGSSAYGAVPPPVDAYNLAPGSAVYPAAPGSGPYGAAPGSGPYGAAPGSGPYGVAPGTGGYGAMAPAGFVPDDPVTLPTRRMPLIILAVVAGLILIAGAIGGAMYVLPGAHEQTPTPIAAPPTSVVMPLMPATVVTEPAVPPTTVIAPLPIGVAPPDPTTVVADSESAHPSRHAAPPSTATAPRPTSAPIHGVVIRPSIGSEPPHAPPSSDATHRETPPHHRTGDLQLSEF